MATLAFGTPLLLAWVWSTVDVMSGFDPTGLKLSQLASVPPVLWVGLAIDGNWVPLLVAVIGCGLAAGFLYFRKNPDAATAIASRVNSLMTAQTSQTSQTDKMSPEVFAPSHSPSRSDSSLYRSSRDPGEYRQPAPRGKIWPILAGAVLFVGGVVLAVWTVLHRPLTRSDDPVSQMLMSQSDTFMLSTGGFYVFLTVALVATVVGLIMALLGIKKF